MRSQTISVWAVFVLPIKSLVCFAFTLFILGCSSEKKNMVSTAAESFGAISMRISLASASNFKSIVQSGSVTVSAMDMTTMVSEVTIDDTSLIANVEGVPTGRNRLVEIKGFDSLGVMRYQGSTFVNIATDSTIQANISVIRLTGNVAVTGKVIEGDSTSATDNTAWSSPTALSLGAQGSASLGAALDLDTTAVWLAASAHANLEKIDLVFTYYGGAFHLDDAVTAQKSGVTYSSAFDTTQIKSVDMVKVATMPSSQEIAKSAFETSSVIHGSQILGGERFVVQTTEGKLTLVSVKALNGSGAAGSVDLEVYGLSIP